MTNKLKIKELERRIDEVLYYVWDPIGVSEEPCARGEYSSYTMTILKYVLNEDLEKITNQLKNIEIDSMGLTSNSEQNLIVAKLLLEYKNAIEEGLK
ncbi:hypothetical protein SHK09_15065 [Polaribacter sp. PL03]|uniref:hypothetical protein n=1 Tax=Polaribacter sp. PL03 TaxID=3088353 RepID=UPI0029CAE6A7|nr:hypothetical protein [Polaribacter sp. PL03]MDX6748116.1 hypothetical protein [Polaribacter sp. PL03]